MVNDSRYTNTNTNRGQRRLNPRALNDHLNKEMSELENLDVKIQHLSSTITENFSRKDSKFLIAYAKCAYNATCQVNYIFRVKEKIVVNDLVQIHVEITNFHNHDRKSNQTNERQMTCPFFEEENINQSFNLNSKQHVSVHSTFIQDQNNTDQKSSSYCPFFECPQTKLFMKNDAFTKSLLSIKSNENFKSDICPVKSVLSKPNLNKRTTYEAFYDDEPVEINSDYKDLDRPSAFKRVRHDFAENRNLKDINQNSSFSEIKQNSQEVGQVCSYKNNWIEILKEVIKKDLPLFSIDKTHLNKEESFLHFYNLFFNHFISKMQTF